VRLSRWHEQDGFVRGSILIAAIIVIVAVLVLDTVQVVNASLGVRQNATDAADQALSTYVETENSGMALASASTFLELHNAVLIKPGSAVKAVNSGGPSQATVTITAVRKPHTYVLHYLQNLPLGIGPWIHKNLNPRATETNSANS
jgi:hypothetical protein